MKFLSDILAKAGLIVDGAVTLNSVANATTDTDRFLTIDSGVVKYRTGAELLTDINAQPLLTNPITGTGTATQIAFFTGSTILSSDSGLYWDNTNKRLGVSTSTPYTNLQIGSGSGAKYIGIVDTGDATYNIAYIGHNASKLHIGFSNSNTSIAERNAISIDSSTLYVGLGVSAPVNRLQIGSMGATGFSGNTFAFGNGTAATAFFQASTSTQMYVSTYLAIMPSGSGTGNVVVGSLTSNGFRLEVVGTMKVTNTVTFDSITNATTDTDRFLVSDAGVIKYRTGAQLLSDIGGQSALTNPVTGTGTTNYIPKFTGASTIGNSNLINDASGNLGLAITPSAWGNFFQAIEGNYGTSFTFDLNVPLAHIASNCFNNNTNWIYKINAPAARYAVIGWTGSHLWYTAPTGTAGNPITFTEAMTLNSSGNLLLGTTTDVPSAILNVSSVTKGILIPRMTTTQKNAIASPATGLQVYDTSTNSIEFYNGTVWQSLSGGGGGGVTTLAAIGSTPNANGATISGTTLTLQPASEDFGGVVTTGSQNFSGVKKFFDGIQSGDSTLLNYIEIAPAGISFINNSLPGSGTILASNVTGAYNYELPDRAGTFALSVNSVFADVYGDITLTAGDVGAEPALGNPSVNGYVLSSTTAGVRSWVAPGGGGSAYTVTSVSTTYTETATSGTKIVKANTTGGAFSVTLPTAVGNTATIIIKKTAGVPSLTVDGAGTETIDDGLTAVINRVYESITLVSDNANWLIV